MRQVLIKKGLVPRDQTVLNWSCMWTDRPDELPQDAPGSGRRPPTWLRRLGLAGFLFFLIKGLLWLLVPALLVGRRWLGD